MTNRLVVLSFILLLVAIMLIPGPAAGVAPPGTSVPVTTMPTMTPRHGPPTVVARGIPPAGQDVYLPLLVGP